MILEQIADFAKIRVKIDKEKMSLEEIKSKALKMETGSLIFEKTLKNNFPSVICEVKKASPSKGVISKDFPYLEIAKDYEKSGASCLSVLTEPKWFLGSDVIFKEIRKNVTLPMLRKDFTIDEYQIYQSKLMGADCVLLIVALLSLEEIRKYLKICDALGMSALVETHDKDEILTAIKAGARIIGVNNRNLKDFSVNLKNADELKAYIPEDVIYVAESGIMKEIDAISLLKNGADALLIGEALMRCDDKKAFIQNIIGADYD